MSGEDYDPYWCVIRPDHPSQRHNNNGAINNQNTNDYDPYWNTMRPPAGNLQAVSQQQQQQQQLMQARTFGANVMAAQQQFVAHAPAPPLQQRSSYGGHAAARRPSNDMDIVTDNATSHVGYGSAEQLRAGSNMHERRIPFSSGHTLDKTIASGDITMSSESFERLRLNESGDGALYSPHGGGVSDDEYHAWPETYDDQQPQKRRAMLEPVRSHNVARTNTTIVMGEKPKDMQVSPLRSPDSFAVPGVRMTTSITELMRSIARPPLGEDGDVIEVGELEDPPTPGIIQPWMAVIGDKSARMPPRLTAGSMTLREVKTWYQDNRENYSSAADLYRDAMDYYFNLMKQRFGRHFPSDRLAQEATILVYCGSPEKPIRMERVQKPHCYKHRADIKKANANKYGVAKLPIATQQFLTSKDGPPPLDQQLLDYCTRVEKRDDLPELEKKTFILYLSFTKALLDQANAGCPIAKSGLKKTNLNTSLRDLWKELSGI